MRPCGAFVQWSPATATARVMNRSIAEAHHPAGGTKMNYRFSLAALALAFALGCAGPAGVQGQTGTTGSQGPAASMARWTSLKDIMFDYDKASIRPSEMSKTSDIATYMNQNPSARLGIDGSTDLLRGTNQYNVALSQQRISNVREALIQAGVSTDRMETGGFGVARMKCSDSPEVCSQRDGRVEVLVRPGS